MMSRFGKILSVSIVAIATVVSAHATIVTETQMTTGLLAKEDWQNKVKNPNAYDDDIASPDKYPSMVVAQAMIDDAITAYSGERTSVGSESLPVYIDAQGKPQEITSYEGNAATATYATSAGSATTADSATTAGSADSVAWSGVTGKPTINGKSTASNVTLSAADVGAVAATGQTASGILTTNANGTVGVSATIAKSQVAGLTNDLNSKQNKLDSGANGNVTITGNTGVVKTITASDGAVSVTRGTITNDDIASGAQIAVSKINGAEASAHRVTDTENYNDFVGPENNGDEYYPSMDVALQIVQDELGTYNQSHSGSDSISAMTGYQKAATAGAIETADSLNTAIGKLEKTLDGKQATLTSSNVTTTGSGVVKSISASNGVVSVSAGTVGANEIASNAVTTVKIADKNVTAKKLADGAVTSGSSNVTVTRDATSDAFKISVTETNITGKQDKLSSGANGNVTITNNNSVTADTGVVKSVTANDGTVAVTRGTIATTDIADGAVTGAKIANGTITDADIASGAQIAVSKINGAEASVNRVVDKVNYNDYLGPSNNGTTYYPSMDVAQEMIDDALGFVEVTYVKNNIAADANTVMVRNSAGTYVPAVSGDVAVATDTTTDVTTLTVNHATAADKIPFVSGNSTTYASIWIE